MLISLRKICVADLAEYAYWQSPVHKYHRFNGPYFYKKTEQEVALEIATIAKEIKGGNQDPTPGKMLISNHNNDLLGEVNWYWKSEATNWLEVGVVLFNEGNWGKGWGYQALRLWIAEIFRLKPALVRIGLTTWSGNKGMIRLAEKLGMQQEACYRKARILDGKYYDSISYGLLKEEWEST